MRQHAASAIPAKLANGIYRFFPNSIVRMTYNYGGGARKASASLQGAAFQQLVLATRNVIDQVACNYRHVWGADSEA